MISPSGSRHWFKGINSATYDASEIFSSKKLRNIVKSRWQMENLKRYVYREINNGQATKGARRMPWHWEPMKDVVSCDKPWGGANIL